MKRLTAWIINRQIATSFVDVDAYLQQPLLQRLRYVQRHGKHVRKVTIATKPSSAGYNDYVIMDLCKNCPDVEVFNCNISLGQAVAAHTSATWSKLTHLTLHVDNAVAFGKNCQSLIDLTVFGPNDNTELWLEFFATCSPHLRKISTYKGFEEQVCHSIAARCALLEEITMEGVVTDDQLLALASGCRRLRTLKLLSRAVTDAGVSAVARNGALTTVCLPGCNVSDAGLQDVAEHCAGLESLKLIINLRLSDATLVLLGLRCHQLRRIEIGGCNFTSAGLQSLVEGCPLLLDLCLCRWPHIGPAIEAVARNCPVLRAFKIRHSEAPGISLRKVARHCLLLEDVSLGGRKIGDKTVAEFAKRCSNLKRFRADESAITAEGVRTIALHCGPRLDEISLPYGVDPYSYDIVKMKPPSNFIVPVNTVNVKELRAWLLSGNGSPS
jgi:hypothetical protein